jgi:uncharacterized protein YigE (DUF2233 family)
MLKKLLNIGAFVFCTNLSVLSQTAGISWQKIDSGLLFSEILSPVKSDMGDSKITILKIDPENYDFKLITAKEKNEKNRTISDWVKEKKLIAAINAGLYQEDGKTNVGYMKNFNFINNSHLNSYNSILAFNRKDSTVPEVQIIDLKCQIWEELKNKYNSYTQSIRMLDCNQNNTWTQQQKKFSMSVVAIDKKGNVLFIFVHSPYSVHDFIDILKNLPIDIYNAIYLEGSFPASFYLNCNGIKVEKSGSFIFEVDEADKSTSTIEIPNIIGIVKKNKSPQSSKVKMKYKIQ